jgi:hypothetical protein
MIRRPIRMHLNFPALTSCRSVQCVRPTSRAASSIFRSGSMAREPAKLANAVTDICFLRLGACAGVVSEWLSNGADSDRPRLFMASTTSKLPRDVTGCRGQIRVLFDSKVSRPNEACLPALSFGSRIVQNGGRALSTHRNCLEILEKRLSSFFSRRPAPTGPRRSQVSGRFCL